MTRRAGPFLVAALMLLAAACGDEPAGPAGPSDADQPWGRTFVSVEVTEDGAPRPLVEGTTIRLEFDRENRQLAAHAGCNHMGADLELDGDRLRVGDIAQTLIGCPPGLDEQDAWLNGFLRADPTWNLDGDTLTLTSGTTVIELADRRAAEPDAPLERTRWEVTTTIHGEVAGSVSGDAHLVFADGEVDGSTGCNDLGGRATVADSSGPEGTIEFAELHQTDMACEPEARRLEEAVLAVVAPGTVTYEIEGTTLTLHHTDGYGLVLRAAEDA